MNPYSLDHILVVHPLKIDATATCGHLRRGSHTHAFSVSFNTAYAFGTKKRATLPLLFWFEPACLSPPVSALAFSPCFEEDLFAPAVGISVLVTCMTILSLPRSCF